MVFFFTWNFIRVKLATFYIHTYLLSYQKKKKTFLHTQIEIKNNYPRRKGKGRGRHQKKPIVLLLLRHETQLVPDKTKVKTANPVSTQNTNVPSLPNMKFNKT